MTRRQLLASGSAAGSLLAQAKRPNIVLILTDQQSISALGAAGNRHLKTPNLDRLAGEGTRFENSWCASPVCSPARSSLVTGCYPTTTGVVYNGNHLAPDVPTIGEILQAAGYETAWAGKWHLPEPFPGAHVPGGEPNPPRNARGFEFLPFPVEERSLQPFGDFTDQPAAQAAAAFLHRDHSKPFFLGVSLHNPHDICYWVMDKLAPSHPSRSDFEVPIDNTPPLPHNHGRSPDEPEFIRRCRDRTYYGQENTYTTNWDESRWRRYLYAYYRMTERVDGAIGVLLSALHSTGLDRDTILVFTSDHGEGMAAHSWVVKLMLWEEVVSVPLIWRWPGRIPAGKVNRSAFASAVDVVPTLCELAGVTMPPKTHGISLAPVLQGKVQGSRSSVFAQLAPDTKDATMQGRAVRTAQYKYVRFSTGTTPEMLFDLKRDPGETRNLAADEASARELNRHRKLLEEWLVRTGDKWRSG
jgi:arylsulfatase A-like enzyme